MVTAKRARLVGLLVLAVMFGVGALTGAATMRVAESGDRAQSREERPRRPNLWETLQLTPEQQAEVDVIMERRSQEVRAFWNEHGPQLRAIMDSARADVRELLTPEQRELEERFFAERRRHFERH